MNKAILTGRLTKDPELRTTGSGAAYCHFTLAVQRRNPKPGQQDADFIDCTAWNKTAELIERYLVKGSKILVEGSIQKSSYESNGETRYRTEISVYNLEFLDSKRNSDHSSTAGTDYRVPASSSTYTNDIDTTGIAGEDLPF